MVQDGRKGEALPGLTGHVPGPIPIVCDPSNDENYHRLEIHWWITGSQLIFQLVAESLNEHCNTTSFQSMSTAKVLLWTHDVTDLSHVKREDPGP